MKPPLPAQADTTPCPERGELVAFSLGTLSSTDLEHVADHLVACRSCLEAMQGLDDTADDLVVELRHVAWDDPTQVMPEGELTDKLRALAVRPSAALARARRGPDVPPPAWVGPYQVLEQIGEGGMGTVHKALHVHLNKLVALKLLSAERLEDPEAVGRFTQEMKAIGRVSHLHIVQAFDAGVAEVPYLAMELIEGTDLSHLVNQRGRLEVAEACECVRQAALGLQHAHELGLVHRDVKPSNLMLTPSGIVKVLDLGLARVCQAHPAGDHVQAGVPRKVASTWDDVLVGTLDYIAPEQLQRARHVDIRADLYALGCTLYFLLTGRTPFKGGRLADDQAPEVRDVRPEVPPELALLLDQLLARDPAHRPEAPAALAQALLPFVTGANLSALFHSAPNPNPAPALGTSRSGGRPDTSRSGAPIATLVGLAAFVAAFLLGVLWLSGWPGDREVEKLVPPPALVASLTVEQLRPREGKLALVGEVGAAHLPRPTTTDSFRARARFDGPAYCYLIAFGPDAREVLCALAHSQEAPSLTREISYLFEGGMRLPGPGAYAFVVLASRERLPKYAVWKETQARLPGAPPEVGRGVWENDGQKTTIRRRPEGPGDQAMSAWVGDLARALSDTSRSGGPGNSVRVLAFSLQAAD